MSEYSDIALRLHYINYIVATIAYRYLTMPPFLRTQRPDASTHCMEVISLSQLMDGERLDMQVLDLILDLLVLVHSFLREHPDASNPLG